jgi:hypothetical protein
MAVVAQGSAGDGPAGLVSQSGEEQGHPARLNEVVEQAKLELSARYGFMLGEAFEVLRGLAESQRCSVEELADSVVTSGGRLDGDLRGGSGGNLTSFQDESGTPSLSSELLIEAPSATSAFVLAGSLAEYGARAVVDGGIWRVVVDRCSSFSEGLTGALSRTQTWLAESDVATVSVTLNGQTYLLDGSADGVPD